jgi:poly-gamma-glutamate capsule biosynthesis protein CapA/YwtB (metallophosphatase superfamily)
MDIEKNARQSTAAPPTITLFLCGDVMTGRGIDQILPHPSNPELYEPYVRSALEYVVLAEHANGSLAKPVGFDYVWGDALRELERVHPDVRIANLETSVTASDEAWPRKGIHYRMHPANVPCLGAAHLDCCVLANNHVLDWGRSGLEETLATLRSAGLRTAGAGRNDLEAAAPAVIDLPGKGRVLVFAYAMPSSGVIAAWAATRHSSGVNFLDDLSPRSAEAIGRHIGAHKHDGDIAVLSIHWGENWGYAISARERDFARLLVDVAGVDVVHGHSSHHAKGIEVHRDRPIIYGCGDLLNDYEGIGGHESYRSDLGLMYFVSFTRGRLSWLLLIPTRMHRFRVNRASDEDAAWLAATLNREGRSLGTRVEAQPDNTLAVRWS